MFKRCMTLCLVAVLMVGLFFAAALGTAALGKEMSIYELLEHFPMENIDYTYVDKYDGQKHYRTASVWFSPALLLQDARVFSGEMAKSSVALAMAAYHNYYVEQLLVAMGFTVEDNQDVYDRSENELTLQANDYVAYTIAYQDVTYPGTEDTYRIYCVPIKGTTENAEWFSNFNIGTGVEHEGFKTASREVYGELLRHFVSDEVDEDHTIVWLTGHSRGAACANLIAGWLSSDKFEQANPEHVFAYTYACPSVSTEADTTLTNIHNFNNPGDLIPLLPLADWNFKRYGQTHILDNSPEQLRNLRQQFSVATGHAYTAESSSANYEILLTQIFGCDREAFVSSPSNQAILTTVAWFMGGHTDVSLEALLVHLFGEVPDLLVEAVTNIDLVEILGKLLDVNDALTKMITWLADAYRATIGMTDEEFAKFAEENISMINDVEEMTGMDIYCASALLTAKGIYDYMSNDINTTLGCVQVAVSLVTDPSGNISDKVAHGHTQSTYVAWINSMYYGYRGWLGNEDLMFFTADENILSIGEECFFRCIGLNTVTMNVPNIYIGNKAFGLCDGLRMVTLPVDCVQEDTPFYETHNVMMIHYTYGRTGVMQDRTDDDSGLLHANTLEFASGNSIRQIYFDEGITHIGRDLFGSGSNSLKLVSLPSTLKSIGDYAFNSCYSLPEIDLPQGLEHIGSHAFSGCAALAEIDLPQGLDCIEYGAFSDCTALTKIELPQGIASVGSHAFSGCTALTEVTFQPGCKSLGNRAFADCTALQKVNLNEDLEEIGGYAFSDCSSLTTLPKLPAGITTISAGMFYNCDGLLQVTIPNTITAIDDEAFNCCSNIETLIIPDSVVSLGKYCFSNCDGLRTVTLPVDYDFSMQPFGGMHPLEYADGVTTIHYTPGQSGIMTDRSTNSSDNNYYRNTLEYVCRESIQTMDFGRGITRIGAYLVGTEGSTVTDLKLPNTLRSFGDYGFYNCDGLTNLVIPDSVTAIGSYCFYDCDGLTTLKLPDMADSLGLYAFGSCGGLRTVTLPVDYDFSNDPFRGPNYYDYCDGVTAIHYTPGQSGVMTDRSYDANDGAYYQKTLEYHSRSQITSITFADGITHIGNLLFRDGSNSLTEVKLPSTLKTIGDYAFQNCTKLSVIRFPEGIESLGSYSFQNCDGLKDLTIPETITAIGERAFYECSGMEELTLPDTAVSLGKQCFANCDGLRTVTLPVDYDISGDPFYGTYSYYGTTGVTTIHFTYGQTGILPDRSGDSAQSNYYQNTLEQASRNSIRTITFAKGITHIGSFLFRDGSNSLTEVKLPATLKTIGDYAFQNCTKLPVIRFPEGIESLGSYSFQNCDGLKDLTIPETITAIGECAFYECSGMEELTLPDTAVSLGKQCFANCDGLRTVTLPVDYDISCDPFYGTYPYYGTTGVTTIHFTYGQTGILPDRSGDSTQSNYYQNTLEQASRNSIQTITFAEGITHIGNLLIRDGSNSLTEVKLPSTLKTIGDYAFYSCTALPDIHLPEDLVSVGSYVFYNCDSFTSIPHLPVNLTAISDYAFYDCDGLNTVTIPETITVIGERAFYECSGMEELTLPDTAVSLGKQCFANCDGLRTVTLPVDYDISGDPFYGTYSYYGTTGVTTIHFTYGQTGILPDRSGDSAQSNYYQNALEYASRGSIRTITFAEGITHIGNLLIRDGSNSLTEVKLPSTLKTIGDYAFQNCTKLPGIRFPEGTESLGSYSFQNCDSLKVLTIPETITAIGERAFYECSGMEELTLPDTTVSLGKQCFANCDGLRTVTLPVDYDISGDPFYGTYSYYGTTGVTTIHFTYGQTGILPDRSSDSVQSNYYQNALEYASRGSIRTIDIAEGITCIGSYAFPYINGAPEFTFHGNAPEIAANAFLSTTATCRYPGSNNTWSADILQHYGGTLSWVPYDDIALTLSGKSFSLSFEDEILVNFYYQISRTTNVVEHGMLVFRTQPSQVNYTLADRVYDQSIPTADSGCYLATTEGIAAKEMGDTRYYAAYAKLADGTFVYSDAYAYSPKQYAMNMLGKDSTSVKQKALCVAMLNYGAAAQNYFGYRTDDLMNADLTQAQKALVTAYDAACFTGAVAADPNKIGCFAATSGFSSRRASISFEGSFAINYYFLPTADINGNLTLYIWNPADYAAADVLTAANASEVVVMKQQPGGSYWAAVNGIAAKALDDTYYVAGVYTDGDGNTHCTGVIAYSLSRYCINNAKDGNAMQALASNTAMYGYYAKQYFA